MKKILIYLAVCFAVTQATAQITVTAIPPGTRFTLDDLWQITLVQHAVAPNETWLSVSLSVYDDNSSRILTSTTKKFQFGKSSVININKTNLTNYEPLKTTYYQRNFKNELAKQGGVFPTGNYKVEVVCNYEGAGFSEPLGKYAYNINAALVMPIQLVSVFNKDTIEEENPLFTWIPPYPIPAGNITYEIILNEIFPNETRYTALTSGLPMVKSTVNNQNSFVYTPGSPKLQNGKSYAWKVNMVVDGKFYVGSDTWEFTYRLLDSVNYLPEQYYVMESNIPNNCVYIDSNVLPLSFIEDYYVIDSIIQINLYDSSGIIIANEETIPISYNTGFNFTFVSFCPDIITLENGRYVLEIILANHKKYFIRFINNSAPGICAY